MLTTESQAELIAIPLAELATRLPPERWHGVLAALGTHCRAGDWVVSSPDDVPAALSSAALEVAPPPGQDGPAARLLAQMARFANGAEHQRRRDLLIRLLPPVPRTASTAAAQANSCPAAAVHST